MNGDEKKYTWEELVELVKALPDLTDEQREEQAVSFVYGNLMASTNHGRGITREQVRAAYRTIHADEELKPNDRPMPEDEWP